MVVVTSCRLGVCLHGWLEGGTEARGYPLQCCIHSKQRPSVFPFDASEVRVELPAALGAVTFSRDGDVYLEPPHPSQGLLWAWSPSVSDRAALRGSAD